MAGAESFTVLAILEARDQASEIFAKIDESLDKFSDTAKAAADTAKAAGEAIDESLLQTASGADALDIAEARVAASQERATAAAQALADAERELLAANEEAAVSVGDAGTAAADRLTAADEALAAAQKEAAASAKALSDAQKVQSDTATAAAAKNDEAAASSAGVKDSSEAAGVSLGSMGKIAGITALGLGVAGAVMVKAAGNFQDSTVHLMTDAGVSAKNLAMVQAGILNVSTATGQSAESITDAMYHIASSGFTAQNGLNILKVAAEGARVGGADLDTTSKALVGTLTAYYGSSLSAGQATKDSTSLMAQMIKTVGTGDMRMQDLASSLANVTPVAASAHISFAQVGAAIATMTSQGFTAQRASMDLANMLRSMLHPTQATSNEMRALGLNANQVSAQLGSKGITGTLQEFTSAILSNTKGGSVLLGYMNQMSPAAQGLARQIMAGTISTQQLRTAVYSLSPQQAKLISLFESSATSATGLKQTYTGAMAALTGGATGLNTALMLTGTHMKDFTSRVQGIGTAGKQTSGDLAGWPAIQATINFKLAQAKTAIANTGIAIGTALLPAVSALLSRITAILIPIAEFTAKHRTLTEVLFAGVTAIAATIAIVAVASKTFKAITNTISGVSKAAKGTWAVMQKLAQVFKTTSAEQASAAQEGAEAQETAAGEAAAAEETAAGESAAAQEEAAAESSGSWIASAASTVASWATAGARMIGQAAVWVAQNAVKAATVVGQNVAAAASTAGAWAMAGLRMIAQGAVWVAQNTAKVAIVVAENIAGALATAAAWIAANAVMLLGIGLVIAAVVAAVVLIITHWKQISAAVAKVWDDVYSFISKVVSDVVDFIKSHWMLIVGVILGPLALAAALIYTYWDKIKAFISDAVKDAIAVVTWYFVRLPEMFLGWLESAARAVESGGSRVLSWFESLPGRIVSLIAEIPSMLFSSGEHIVESLASGITSAAGSALSGAMSSVANTIKSFLPFSPAKRGPLSGAGDPGNSGLSIARNVARGIQQNTPLVASAAKSMASAAVTAATGPGGTHGIGSTLAAGALSALPPGGSGTAGGSPIVINVTGNTVMTDADITKLTNRIGKVVASQMLPAAGRKVNIRG